MTTRISNLTKFKTPPRLRSLIWRNIAKWRSQAPKTCSMLTFCLASNCPTRWVTKDSSIPAWIYSTLTKFRTILPLMMQSTATSSTTRWTVACLPSQSTARRDSTRTKSGLESTHQNADHSSTMHFSEVPPSCQISNRNSLKNTLQMNSL